MDEGLHERLRSDPHGALSEKDIEVSPETEIGVVCDSEETCCLVMPPNPNVALSGDSLGTVSGGFGNVNCAATFTYGRRPD